MDQAVATPTRADAPQPDVIRAMAMAARQAARTLARSTTETRNAALKAAAAALRASQTELLAANARDLAAFGGAAAFRDRLTLTPERVEAMAQGLEQVASLPDPVGHVMAEWDRPNGLRIRRVATPVGVIGMIYESRPNVGADAAALCIKSGNAVILRGGSDSLNSARVIHAACRRGCARRACRWNACRSRPMPNARMSRPCWGRRG